MTSPESNQHASSFVRARQNIETGFARWGEICHDHPWWIIISLLLCMAIASSGFRDVEVDTSNESYLRDDDPSREIYDAFQREWGKDERIVILVESPGNIINEAFLRQLQRLHQRLESIPMVEKVDSLINARLTIGRDDELIVKPLLEDWPQTDAEFDALRERILSKPLYRSHFVSPDMAHTIVMVTPDTYTASYSRAQAQLSLDEFDFDDGFAEAGDLLSSGFDPAEPAAAVEVDEDIFITDTELYAILDAIYVLKDEFQTDTFKLGLAGSPVLMHQMTFILAKDMFVFSGMGILLISALLFLVFRRWVMVILPVLVSALSVYFTFALMCFVGMTITTSVQILPSLLLAIGVGNSVHLFTVYFQAVDRGKHKREALHYAMGHSGLAVLMTGLTTAGGLISFITANIKPVADIGIVAPMGICSALVFSLMLLPALIAITPFKDQGLKNDSNGLFQRFLSRCAHVSTHYPLQVVGIWFAIIAGCMVLVLQIKPSHFPIDWFPVDSDIRVSTKAIDKHFGGATFSEIVVDTGINNGLHDPELLQRVDKALQFMGELEVNDIRHGKATSLVEVSKELHQALNENDPAFYRIPDQRQLIAQELLLFENSGSDDLEDLVDTSFSKMRITAKMPFVDGVRYPEYLSAMQQGFRDIIGDKAELTFTGVIVILAGSVKALIGDTIRAYVLAFLIISPLMMLLVGSVRTGLISMIPNLAPIIITLALMSALSIPLDAFTLLIGSIALGLAVDDTIHFMHNFQRYYTTLGDAEAAVKETLRTTGKALMITSMVLSAAFFINMLGTMYNLQDFGLLTGFCIIVAFLADVLLAPALMTLLARAKQKQLKEKFA